jgi:arginase
MIKVVGIPFDANSSFLKGPALAPPRIRLMETDGSANAFCEYGTEILAGKNYTDIGDLSFINTNPEDAYNKIKTTIQQELLPDFKIVCLGGDHSVSFPIIEAYADKFKNLNVLHLDAHADLYNNFDNNPYSHASPFARLMEKNIINSLTQVGIRTLNTHQKEQAQRFGVNIIEMKDLNYNFIKTLQAPLYISLDLDVLDPAFAPGVSHHEPGGLTARELIKIIQTISASIVGADIVEYNPTRDINNMTAMVAYKLFKELIYKMME